MIPATVSETSVGPLLQNEAQLPAELEHLNRSELESLRSAIETALARRPLDPPEPVGQTQDDGFSCEWWPPD
jgi:hypothetical protein